MIQVCPQKIWDVDFAAAASSFVDIVAAAIVVDSFWLQTYTGFVFT